MQGFRGLELRDLALAVGADGSGSGNRNCGNVFFGGSTSCS